MILIAGVLTIKTSIHVWGFGPARVSVELIFECILCEIAEISKCHQMPGIDGGDCGHGNDQEISEFPSRGKGGTSPIVLIVRMSAICICGRRSLSVDPWKSVHFHTGEVCGEKVLAQFVWVQVCFRRQPDKN